MHGQKNFKLYTGRFIMFSVTTNIHKKENQRTYLNGIVHSHRKTEKVFFDDYRYSMCAVSPVVHTSNISSCQKKNFLIFPVAVNNSIKVGPLIFLL